MKKLILILFIIISFRNLKSQCGISFSLNTSVGGYTLPCNPSSMIINAVNTSTIPSLLYYWDGPMASTASSFTCDVPGTYTITGYDATFPSCYTTQVITIIQNSLAPTVSVTPTSTNVTCNGPYVTFSASCNVTGGIGAWYQPNHVQITSASINPTLSTNNPGKYTAIFTNTLNGCTGANTAFSIASSTAIPSVTINALPNPIIYCSSIPTLQLIASPGPAPKWFNLTNLTTSVSVNWPHVIGIGGNYLYEYMDGNICKVGIPIYIGTNTLAPTVSTAGSGTMCSGQTAIIIASGATSYTWNTLATTNSISVSPSTTTTYTVKGANAINGCTNAAVYTQSVSSCIGIKENSLTQNIISVYPNPVSNTIYISSEQNVPIAIEIENSEIEITNYLGQTVLILPYSNSIDVSKLSQGFYNLKIRDKNNQIYYSKFIKEN